MSVEQECGEVVRKIEEFRRQEGNATDAGKFDPSLDAGIAPRRHAGGGEGQRGDPRTERTGNQSFRWWQREGKVKDVSHFLNG
jgi:hypothetical protein